MSAEKSYIQGQEQPKREKCFPVSKAERTEPYKPFAI